MTIAATLISVLSLSMASPVLRDGDRVVFLGDSITVAHTWTREVEEFVLTRDPEKAITFINAGVGGHTAADGLARLDTDVLVHRPTVVVLNFGMNDSGYPDDTDGAAFEKNMGAIIDRLKAGGVRAIVWADTTPYDPEQANRSAKAGERRERIAALVAYTAEQCARRGLVLVRWNQRVQAAVDAWAKAKRKTKLVPDKVHPSPLVHAVLAAAVVRALGYEPEPVRLHAAVDGGVVRGGGPAPAPWDGVAPLTLQFGDVAAPLLWAATDDDARDVDDKDVRALRQVLLSVTGLPPAGRFRISVDGADVGVHGAAALARGVDVNANAVVPEPPAAPPGSTMTVAATPPPSFSTCNDANRRPFERDHACLWGRLFQRDQLRIAMRHERTRWLPDFVADRGAAHAALLATWVDEADRAIRQQARTQRGLSHVVVVTAVPPETDPLPLPVSPPRPRPPHRRVQPLAR
jgi:lysophospholipase L1-like esterase